MSVRRVTLQVMINQQFLKKIFAGDNAAFQQFYGECRTLFLAHFHKRYPKTKVSLTDLYQDTVMELWSKIMEGRLTEESLTCKLSSFVISIGENKLKEETRRIIKDSRLKKGEPIFKKRKSVLDTLEDEDETDDTKAYPLQSKKQQKELERDTRINQTLYLMQRKVQINSQEDSDDAIERLREWSEFLQKKYEELGYPCNQLLRDTWYNDLTDNEIMEAFGGYFSNTNVIKTKRYRCHKALLNMFNAWKYSQK